jgi:CDGSH-type Zn-finger protein
MRFTPQQDLTVALCGCKQTKEPPYCDGSHLPFRAARDGGGETG